MKRMINRQAGLGIVEVLLIALTVIGLMASGWVLYQRHQSTNKAASTTQQTKTSGALPSQTVDPYAGWKTYTNTDYSFSFQYPSSWVLTTNLSDIGRGGPEGTIAATSPNGTVVHFDPNFGGKGGDCWDDQANTRTTRTCSTLNTLSIERLSTSSQSNPVYFYTASLTASHLAGGKTRYFIYIGGGKYVPTVVGSQIGVVLGEYDDISNTNKAMLTVYVNGKNDDQNDSPSFFETLEVKEATPILKSFRLVN